MQLNNISREDQTTYACVVSNAVGSAYTAISLSVEWPPKFQENSDEDNSTVRSYDTRTDNSGNKTIVDKVNNSNASDTQSNKTQTVQSNKNDLNSKDDNNLTTKKDTIIDREAKNNKNASNSKNIVGIDKNKDETENILRRRHGSGMRIINVVKGDDTYLDCSVDAKPIAKVSKKTTNKERNKLYF